MKIVFLDADTLGATPTSEFASLGEFVSYPTSTREEALARVGNCDTLIINKIIVDAALMDAERKRFNFPPYSRLVEIRRQGSAELLRREFLPRDSSLSSRKAALAADLESNCYIDVDPV